MQRHNHTQSASDQSPRVVLDVRDDLKSGREPFTKIMSTVATLENEQELLLLAPFEPIPLFAVMREKGFDHTARQAPSGDWEVLFTQTAAEKIIAQSHMNGTAMPVQPTGPKTVKVDARGLEPPQPLMRILEALTHLPSGAKLYALTDRRPMHLYAHLAERGFSASTVEQPDGSFLTRIERIDPVLETRNYNELGHS